MKVEMAATEDNAFHHFSHQHPLEHSILPEKMITCYGCNLEIEPGKEYYNCKTCSFSLHRVCSNMPRKTRHPSHPNHHLALLVSPSSARSNFKCKACGYYVRGFYYYCADCSIHYHSLCLALPLSVTIYSHSHALKIVFSPPYDFCCDLCDKPSYKGWLYRCRFCEFDSHISCAISNQSLQALPVADTMKKQIIYSSASIRNTKREIDYESESNELMQLVLQGAARGAEERKVQEVIYTTTVAGWDERLNSPKRRNGRTGQLGLYQTKSSIPSMAGPREQLPDQDPLTLVSEDSTIPSYQFSELCFSIDLLKSPSSDQNKVVPEAEAFKSHDIMAIPNRASGDEKQLLDYPIKPVLNPLYRGPENQMNEAFLTRGFTRKFGQNGLRMANGYGGGSDIKDQIAESDTGSCCWKLFSCCSSPRYEKYSN